MASAALYVHIPFCVKKCAYCDFVSFPGRESDWGRYLDAVEDEIAARRAQYGRLHIVSIYIGGGTPSLLPADAVMRLSAVARARFFVEEGAEFTVECNPGTVDREKLIAYRDAGVNRLSFGMQAAQPSLLHSLGRIHGPEDTVRAVELAREARFQNLNLDLMCALPGQDMEMWVDSLKRAMDLKPEHLSLYSLILEEGTPLKAAADAGEIEPPGEEICLSMQHAARRILSRRGYERYEISNYAQPGFACRHNMIYWRRGDYLGVGCAAHSFLAGYRFANTASLDGYLRGAREAERNPVAAAEAVEEAILLETRTTTGIDLNAFRARYGEDLARSRKGAIEKLRALGLVDLKSGRLFLTEKGMDLQNAVVTELVTRSL